MNIGKIIKANNPKSYEKLRKIRSENKKENLTESIQ